MSIHVLRYRKGRVSVYGGFDDHWSLQSSRQAGNKRSAGACCGFVHALFMQHALLINIHNVARVYEATRFCWSVVTERWYQRRIDLIV